MNMVEKVRFGLAAAWHSAFAPRGLSADRATELERAFVHLVEVDQLYLEQSLTLKEVAARLGVPPRVVSYVAWTRLGENFSGFINRHRVEAAAKALRSPDRAHTNRIMFQCGFGSESIFEREFKRCFGVTPKQYRRQFLEDQVGS